MIEPGRGGFFGDNALRVDVVVPEQQQRRRPHRHGRHPVEGPAGHAQLRSGSGDCTLEIVDGHLLVETGSGDIRVDDARGDLKVKSGSGDVEVGEAGGTARSRPAPATSPSRRPAATTVVKTGSGDLSVGAAHDDTSFSTGCGDLSIDQAHRGRLTAKGASGDVPIGVRPGVPVWTDITTVSGTIRSDLQGAGQPQEGQDHIEVRAKTVSGDIVLTEV